MSDPRDREALIGYWLQKAERAVASAVRELQDGDLASFDRAEVEQLLGGTREFVAWCREHLGLSP